MKKRLLLAALLASTTSGTLVLAADSPTAKYALGLKPVQSSVDYETPEGADLERSTVRPVQEKGLSGWIVQGPDGRPLRRFLDTDGGGSTDLWCYFDAGIEVYRDIDANGDGKADQYRWLGTAGTRWGLDRDQDGTIDQWKMISAEEVSAELVAAIASGDRQRFERLLIREDEMQQLGLGDDFAETIATKRRQALRDFDRFVREQNAIASNSRWVHFAATMPGIIPAGSGGAEKDLVVYENAVAMHETEGKTGQLIIGTLVKVGDTWRLVDLPQDAATDQTLAGLFFSGSVAPGGDAAVGGGLSGDLQELVSRLEKIDKQLPSASGGQAAKLHDQRADVLEGIIAASEPSQRVSWVRQLADTVGAAIQENAYPDGLKRLQALSRSLAGSNPSLQAYVDYQIISAEYAQRLTAVTEQKDFPKVQEWWFQSLETFVNEHADTPESAQAMLQLGLSKEFEDDEKAAISWYSKVANQFPETDLGRKAAGAVLRLESVGRPIALKGRTLDNRAFDISQLRGKPVVVHYWATWCEPCKQDMKLLQQLKQRYKRADLQIVGINVDGVREDAARFVNQARLPWITLFAEGGLEASPLANALGVQTLPTMLLIDQSGKVVRHNVTASQLDQEIDNLVR